MKAKKRVLSTILSLSSILLVGCNKNITSSSSCSITTSTPTIDSTPEPTPTKTVEELNKELFDNYAKINNNKAFLGFKDEIPDEYLNLETIIIPETIASLQGTAEGAFSKFSKLKTIKIPATLTGILTLENESVFKNIPNLEDIEVDENNQNFLVPKNSEGKSTNCLIHKIFNYPIAGWGDVEIPKQITKIRSYDFSSNSSITSIKLHSNVSSIDRQAFKNMDNLSNIDLNGNTNYTIQPNTNLLYSGTNITTIYAAWGDVTIPSSIVSPVLDGYSSVTSVTLHDSVTTLSANAFRGTKIKSLKIPASVNSIHLLAFNELTDIEDIQIDNNNQTYEIVNNCIFDRYNGHNSVAIYYAYGDAVIPDYKVTLGADALQGSYSLSSLTLHNKFTSLSLNSFRLLPSTDKFTTIKFKGTIAEFKEMKQYASFYDTLKDRTTLNVEFLESTDGINWTVKETYKMSELESINIE